MLHHRLWIEGLANAAGTILPTRLTTALALVDAHLAVNHPYGPARWVRRKAALYNTSSPAVLIIDILDRAGTIDAYYLTLAAHLKKQLAATRITHQRSEVEVTEI